MPTITAVRSGNWSDTSHVTGPWPGASTPTTKPGAADVAQSGAYTVTIDESITVTTLTATSSGHFEVITAPISITSTTINQVGSSYTGGALRCNHAIGTVSVTVTTITGTSSGLTNADQGTVNITGNCTGGAVSDGVAVNNASTGIINITGNVSAGAGARAYGIINTTTGTVIVSGSATGGGGSNSFGAYNASTGALAVNTAIGGTSVSGFGLYGANSGGVTSYKIIGSQTNGNSAVGGFCKMLIDATNKITVKRSDTGADYDLTPGVGGGGVPVFGGHVVRR